LLLIFRCRGGSALRLGKLVAVAMCLLANNIFGIIARAITGKHSNELERRHITANLCKGEAMLAKIE
jgi:hypothetical protein